MKKIKSESNNIKIKDVFVLVPVFNEAPVLEGVIRELLNYFENVIVVNDGSTDDSSKILSSLDVILIEHHLNLGQGAAINTGFRFIENFTGAKAVITFDSDGQHSINDAIKLANKILTCDELVILGSRFLGSVTGVSIYKLVLLKIAVFMTKRFTQLQITDTHNGLKAFKRSALQYLFFEIDGFAFESELVKKISKHNLSISEVPINIEYTHYSKKKGQKLSNAFIIFESIIKNLR